MRPQLDRQPREQEADGDERRQHACIAARQPEEACTEGERENDRDDADTVASRPRIAEEPPRLQPDRVRLRGDVEEMRERDRPRKRAGDSGRDDRCARRQRLPALDPGEQRDHEQRHEVEEVPLLDAL